jgi:hypothetical protein
MKWNRTKAFINKIRGKKTPTGLRVNAKGETPNGTKINGIRNGKPTTTGPQGNYVNTWNGERLHWNGLKYR